MPDRFDQFVQTENIRNFKRQIETEIDPRRLAILKLLLKAEEAKAPTPEKLA